MYLKTGLKYGGVGGLVGLLGLTGIAVAANLSFKNLGGYEWGLAFLVGMGGGIAAKGIMLWIIEMMMRANIAAAQLNAKRAEMLGHRLKIETKDKIQAHVIKHATSIILQMQGEQAAPYLEHFFDHKMHELTEDAYFKIDRHLNYLSDRAVHGDVQSLKRLYQFYRRDLQEREIEINQLLDRIINTFEEVNNLKDKVDTLYDNWKFRRESRAYVRDECEH